MVYVNSKKYACESCIKGHRSSSCHHNDRPLFEIKKKGRPVSQCEKCREARQARRIHAKCTCGSEGDANESATGVDAVKRKGKRFVPSVPSLPNGLRDALKASSASSSETFRARQPVDALLNPCHCKDVYNCKCRTRADPSVKLVAHPSRPVDPAIFADGLSALALVAACCSPAAPSGLRSAAPLSEQSSETVWPESTAASRHTPPAPSSHMGENPGAQLAGSSKRKRSPRSSPIPTREVADVSNANLRLLRPIAPALSGAGSPAWPAPSPNQLAPPSVTASTSASSPTTSVGTRTTTSSDNSHCCCGTRCECAGCSLHGLSSAVSTKISWVDNPDDPGPSAAHVQRHAYVVKCNMDCPTCIDYEGGVELPPLSSISGVASNTRAPAPPFLTAFLARAAALPAPPAHTRSSLDPTNVVVYPAGLFKRPRGPSESAGMNEDERPRAFGLVQIPKLEECCGGRCGCAEDACRCGDKCNGCCMDGVEQIAEGVGGKESVQLTPRLSPSVSFARRSEETVPPPISMPSAAALSTCCER